MLSVGPHGDGAMHSGNVRMGRMRRETLSSKEVVKPGGHMRLCIRQAIAALGRRCHVDVGEVGGGGKFTMGAVTLLAGSGCVPEGVGEGTVVAAAMERLRERET